MKTETKQLVTASYGAHESQSFDIVQTGEMFALLSSKIYSDKILAVVRELAANALDAHRMAGTLDTPIDIHLPCIKQRGSSVPTDLTFRIRDYGTGLSETQMFCLYKKYGASDKNHSNEMIGGMGIGSKSPFAYADMFEVNSYYNGTKTMYLCALNAMRVPELKKFGSEATAEPNGLEIRVDVFEGHCWDFENRAERVFRHFPVKPCCNKELQYQVPNILFSGQGWQIEGSGHSHALMGHISYPIEATHFAKQETKLQAPSNKWDYKRHMSEKSQEDVEYRLLELGVTLFLDIGEAQVAASREELQYTETTKAAIKTRLKQVIKELQELVDAKLKGCRDYYEACRAYASLGPSFLRLVGITNFKFGNKVVKCTISVPSIVGTKTFFVGPSGSPKRENDTTLWRADCQIVENDLPVGGYSRLYAYVKANNCRAILVDFRKTNWTPQVIVPVVSSSNPVVDGVPAVVPLEIIDEAENRRLFLEEVGACDDSLLVKASNLPAPPKRRNEGPVIKVQEIVIHEKYGAKRFGYSEDLVILEDVEDVEGVCFLELNANNFVRHADGSPDARYREPLVFDLMSAAERLGIKLPRTYAVKTAVLPRFKRLVPYAVCFFTEATKLVTKYLVTNDVVVSVANVESLKAASEAREWLAGLFLGVTTPPHPSNKLWPILAKLQRHQASSKQVEAYAELMRCCRTLNLVTWDVEPEDLQQCFSKTIDAYYPLLKQISRYSISELRQACLRYMELVDLAGQPLESSISN